MYMPDTGLSLERFVHSSLEKGVNMLRIPFCVISLALFVLVASPVPAQGPERITVTHTYVMGDSESKNGARVACLNEAKRKIAEQAGTYVEVLSKAENFQLAQDEVLSFTAALIRVEIDKEEVAMDGRNMAVTLTVTGTVDPEEVKKRLDELAEKRLAPREEEGSLLHQATGPEKVPMPELRSGPEMRRQIADTPETVHQEPRAEEKAAQPRDPYAEKKKIAEASQRDTSLAMELIEKGMSRSEVEQVLGSPGAVKYNPRRNYVGYKYGHVWVVFRDDVVACVRKRLENRPNAGGDMHCEGFAFNFVVR